MLTDTLRDLHAAVCREPGNSDLRLVFADCCEESGDVERAEFIRVQVEISRTDMTGHQQGNDPEECHKCWLVRRERELWLSNRHRWGAQLPGVIGDVTNEESWWHNGFPDHLTLPCQQWLTHGPALVRATPVVRVVLSDREPFASGIMERYSWHSSLSGYEDASYIPDEILERMTGEYQSGRWVKLYLTRAAALSALAEAAIRWAWSVVDAVG